MQHDLGDVKKLPRSTTVGFLADKYFHPEAPPPSALMGSHVGGYGLFLLSDLCTSRVVSCVAPFVHRGGVCLSCDLLNVWSFFMEELGPSLSSI